MLLRAPSRADLRAISAKKLYDSREKVATDAPPRCLSLVILDVPDSALIWSGLSNIRKLRIKELGDAGEDQRAKFTSADQGDIDSGKTTGLLFSTRKRISISGRQLHAEISHSNSAFP